jgi:hypothetical protein
MIVDDFRVKLTQMPEGVCITSEGGISNGSKITNAATGEEIQGVTAVSINLKTNDVVRATIDLCHVRFMVDHARVEYRVASPSTGDLKVVKRIEFADGETLEFIA